MAGLKETTETETLQSPLCRELRTKKFYFLDSIPLTKDDLIDVTGHCWCRRTMQVVGPDGGIVHPDDCGAGRDCYRSQFE